MFFPYAFQMPFTLHHKLSNALRWLHPLNYKSFQLYQCHYDIQATHVGSIANTIGMDKYILQAFY